jgi:hypothetical protein
MTCNLNSRQTIMKFNICIIQPKDYVHSMAFWELAELLLYSLHDLNHQAAIQFNKIDTDCKNIVIGFHLLDIKYVSQLPKNSVLINAEQFLGGTPWNENILQWIRSFEVWDYSTQNIEFFNEQGIKNIKYMELGYQNELSRIKVKALQDIDVLFYGSINDRRAKVLDALKSSGLNVYASFGIYGKDRDDLIARSKLVLNLHYYDSEIFEVVRVFYLLANSIPVVGEINPSTAVSDIYKNSVLGVPYQELVNACIGLVKDDQARVLQGRKGFDLIKKNPQYIYTDKLL